MKDISEDAAHIADMIPWVKARFVEAFDTAEHVAVRLARVPQVRSFWPAAQSTGSENDPVPVVWRPSAAAISRSDEVLQRWLLAYVEDQEHRRLLLAWSASIVAPKRYGSFVSFCRKSGRARSTANYRLLSAFSIVATLLHKNGQSLQPPDMRRVGQIVRFSDIGLGTVADVHAKTPTHWRAEDFELTDKPELRDTSWAEAQNGRRRQRQA